MFIERYWMGLVAVVSLKFLQFISWLLGFEVPKLVRDTELCLPLRFHSLLMFWTQECVSHQGWALSPRKARSGADQVPQ